MKKIFIIISIFLSSFWFVSAQNENKSTTIKITVSTPVPWASCDMKWEWKNVTYECEVDRSFNWSINLFQNIIKWFTFLALTTWVLAITIAWILYSMGWIDDDLMNKSKQMIVKIIIWLIILLSSGYILQLLAPWVYK